jgi:hypothetical protein
MRMMAVRHRGLTIVDINHIRVKVIIILGYRIKSLTAGEFIHLQAYTQS